MAAQTGIAKVELSGPAGSVVGTDKRTAIAAVSLVRAANLDVRTAIAKVALVGPEATARSAIAKVALVGPDASPRAVYYCTPSRVWVPMDVYLPTASQWVKVTT